MAKKLLQDDVDQGHAFILAGGEAEARKRWGNRVAAGKLGVVLAPGKKPRLIGDGSNSAANAASHVLERVRLPSLHAVQRFVSSIDDGSSWTMCSFDVKGARKLVRVKSDEQGYSCFILDGVRYCYRSCYFGCKWAAFWFSRVGAWLVRMLRRVIWVQHGLFLFVDDGLEFLPSSVGPLLALYTLMCLCTIGVPLSWGKLRLGQRLVWIGRKFHADICQASLPAEKVVKALAALKPLLLKGNRVDCRELEKAVGFLGWVCGGAFWLQAWLSSFYKLLKKLRAVTRLLQVDQFFEFVQRVNSDLRTHESLPTCDICCGWKLSTMWKYLPCAIML